VSLANNIEFLRRPAEAERTQRVEWFFRKGFGRGAKSGRLTETPRIRHQSPAI